MAEIYTLIAGVCKGIEATVEECGFKPVIPEGIEKDALPATESGGKITVEYTGEGKALKLEYVNKKVNLLAARKEGEILSSDFSQISVSLLDPEEANEKDVKYISNEFSETMIETFGTKTVKATKSKLPPPVSKAAAKSGMVSYDPNTLANRFTTIYPELREEYKVNCETYGTFLCEDFFINHGNKVAHQIIRENNPTKMKKLFNLLNDIYENGTNEVQSLIVVTILGSLDNDQQMIANCLDYMCSDMIKPVINVNKHLASRNGRGDKLRLKNPPKYKPAKASKKKPGSTGLGM